MNEPLLEVQGLKKYFPIMSGILRRPVGEVKAVDGVNFTIRSGDILGIVGESGSGKSTLARAAIRLIEPTAGTISFMGKNLLALDSLSLRQVRKYVQMVFQDPYASLNPRYTIGESIGEALQYHQLVTSKSEEQAYIEMILKRIGLNSDAARRYPHQFSGGQQQRICIGRAIALNPKLIVCDEAVSALDVSIQAQILNLLAELQETMGLAYLFISHDLSVIHHMCDDVLVMYKGRVVERGPVKRVFENPQDSYTRKLISSGMSIH